MPQIGEIKRGSEVDKTYDRVIWLACEICGRERWVDFYRRHPRCNHCSRIGMPRPRGEASLLWRGGCISTQGYRLIGLSPDDFFYAMANNRHRVFEHRLVMARHLGRNLHPWEVVHHRHTKYPAGSMEDKQDNRIANLQLVSDDRHKQITILENKIAFLGKQLESQQIQFNELLLAFWEQARPIEPLEASDFSMN